MQRNSIFLSLIRKITEAGFLIVAVLTFLCCHPYYLYGQYQQNPHRALNEGEIGIDQPGYYGQPGATYVLTGDISSTRSTLFLGKDVTLDLNGYTLTYAEGAYQHLPNSGFEEGDVGWDFSTAPGAKVVKTKDVHVFLGDKLLSLRKGDEVVSPYLHLPEADRSYYAMVGVTGHHYRDMHGDLSNEMKISLYVEDEKGQEVRVITQYADSTLTSSPVEGKSPRLGGGFIVAHLNRLPAGQYRIRVKAETDCLIDELDIRPAMDVGIGIVQQTHAMGHYDHLYEIAHSAFFDYTKNPSSGEPVPEIPAIQGKGSVTIKNGIIKSGSKGILTFGIQSTAPEVRVILDNVKVVTRGINAIAVDVPQATITHCTFEVDNPFIINRHGAQFYAVDLTGSAPSEVSYSEFIGGQGCLVFKGDYSTIHHNTFVNKQMVTNHYSIMAMGDNSHIFENIIIPETGSGIEIYRQKGIEIYNNLISVEASPPTCEYGGEEYSVAGIRIADYRTVPGSEGAAGDNKVYSNTIYVKGKAFSDYPQYTPMAWGVYYSASGGNNYVFGNDIFVEQQDLLTKADAAAFYICGGPQGYGGKFYNNTITTNVPAAWIASRYGGTANTQLAQNKIIKSGSSNMDFPPFRMGWEACESCFAKDVEFRSNDFVGFGFDLDITEQDHSYRVYWTLSLRLTDRNGEPLPHVDVEILDKDKQVIQKGQTNGQGEWHGELLAEIYSHGIKQQELNPITVKTGAVEKKVVLDGNKRVSISIPQ